MNKAAEKLPVRYIQLIQELPKIIGIEESKVQIFSKNGDLCIFAGVHIERIKAAVLQVLERFHIPSTYWIENGYINIIFDDTYIINLMDQMFLAPVLLPENNEESASHIFVEYYGQDIVKRPGVGVVRNVITGNVVSQLLMSSGAHITKNTLICNKGVESSKVVYQYMKEKSNGTPLSETDIFSLRNKLSSHYMIAEWSEIKDGVDFSTQTGMEIIDTMRSIRENNPTHIAALNELTHISEASFTKEFENLGMSFHVIHNQYEHSESTQKLLELLKNYIEIDERWISFIWINSKILTLLNAFGEETYLLRDIAFYYEMYLQWHSRFCLVVSSDQLEHISRVQIILQKILGLDMEFEVIDHAMLVVKWKGKDAAQKIYLKDLTETLETSIRWINPDLEQSSVAKISYACLVFEILKSNMRSTLNFSIDQLKDINWLQGVYSLYSYIRIYKLRQSLEGIPENNDSEDLLPAISREIIKHLISVKRGVSEVNPSIIIQSTVRLCRYLNSFYAKHRVLNGEWKIKNADKICDSALMALDETFRLLDIKTVDNL